jgi:hypothetical protein
MRKYLLLMLGMPSIALLFLPYTYNVSPWTTISSKIWGDYSLSQLGGPFFLSIPVLIAQTRVLFKQPFSKGEKAAYRVLAFAALAPAFALVVLSFKQGRSSKDLIEMIFAWWIPCAAAIWMVILSAKRLNPEEATTVMLQAAWLPNAILCAIAYWGGDLFPSGWQIGAYLAAFTIVLYTVEITLSMRRKRQTPGAPPPSPS